MAKNHTIREKERRKLKRERERERERQHKDGKRVKAGGESIKGKDRKSVV